MYLLYGVVLVSAAALLCGVVLLGARNPVRPFWADEELIANLYLPLMIGLMIMGIMNFVQFLTLKTLPSLTEILSCSLVVTVMVVIYLKSHIRERVAAFAVETSNAQIISVDFQKDLSEGPSGYRKAA